MLRDLKRVGSAESFAEKIILCAFPYMPHLEEGEKFIFVLKDGIAPKFGENAREYFCVQHQAAVIIKEEGDYYEAFPQFFWTTDRKTQKRSEQAIAWLLNCEFVELFLDN